MSRKQRIRPMREGDLPQVIALEQQSYAMPWPAWVLRRAFRSGLPCWVVEIAGVIQAYGIMVCKGCRAHIMNLCVRPAARGQGVARRLLRHLMGEAGRQGMQWAHLEVRASNRGAIRLYRALGFRKAGLRRRYYSGPGAREHALIMVRQLPGIRTQPYSISASSEVNMRR